MVSRRLAYSYIRFSSERQQLGDSLRRQVALAEDYAARHDMILDTHSYRDMGISAYKGRNAVEGKLATFLRAVDGGHVPPHSFLLVESLDRLSRHDVDEALELFLSIVRRGVTIITLADAQQYSTESIKKDHGISLIISITIMMRAHEESATKSRRIKEAWKARTERGGILTKICPSWLKPVNGKWHIVQSKAKVVRRIYELALQGHGSLTIQRILNSEKVPTFKTAQFWSPGLVTKLLSFQAVYGTLERKRAGGPAIADYYPAIISREIFDRVRLMARARNWKIVGPTKVHPSNLFVGMSYCGGCGSRVLVTAGVHDRYLLQCQRSYCEAGCKAIAISSRAAEKALFEELLQIQPPNAAEAVEREAALADVLRIEDDLRSAQGDRDALIRLALATNEIEAVARKLIDTEARVNELRTSLDESRRRAMPTNRSDIDEARHLCAGLAGGRTLQHDFASMRAKLAILTRRVFARINFDPLQPAMTLVYESGRSVEAAYAAIPTKKPRARASHLPPRGSARR